MDVVSVDMQPFMDALVFKCGVKAQIEEMSDLRVLFYHFMLI